MIATRHDWLPDNAERKCDGCLTWTPVIALELREDVLPVSLLCAECCEKIDAENEDTHCDYCHGANCRVCCGV